MTLAFSVFCLMFPVLLAARLPIFLCLALPAMAYVLMEGFPLSLLAQRMFTGIDIFVLLAIPLFSLAGAVMNAAQLTERLMAFALALVGPVRGGLAAVNVLCSMFFSGITGSAAADASASGTLLIPMMKKAGYPVDFAAALTAVTAIIGPIIPPSIVFIMYATLSGASVASLFMAGIIPGLMMSMAHLGTALWLSHRRGYEKGQPWSVQRIASTGLSASPVLILPVFLVGGILTGIVTPTEAGAIAVVLGLVIGFTLGAPGGGLRPGNLLRTGGLVGFEMADIMLIIGASNIASWILTVEGVPDLMAGILPDPVLYPVLVLLLINLIVLVTGCFLDTFPALIILTPILLPIAQATGMDPVHFGVMISLNLMIGAVTPPVGVLLFIASRIGDVPAGRVARAAVPFLAVSLLVLLVVTFVPALSSGFAALLH